MFVLPQYRQTFSTLILAAASFAAAVPALPETSVAETAVKEALGAPTPTNQVPAAAAAFQQNVARAGAIPPTVSTAPTAPAVTPAKTTARASTATKATTAKPAAQKAPTAAQARQQGIARAQQAAAPRTAARTAIVRSTAYNSIPNQTDSTPFITATGTRTRFGVVALSRDLLRRFPYGTRIRIEDLSGRFNHLLAGRIFVVEDTMHPRKTNQIDVWMSSRSQALQWGARNVRITVVN